MAEAWQERMDLTRRYLERFGRCTGFSQFTQDESEIATIMRRALERGTPATEEEIAWLDRNLQPDVAY